MGLNTMPQLRFRHHTWYVPLASKKGRRFISPLNVPCQEAKATAIDVFHAQITDTRMDVTDLVLKLRMKMSTHQTTWALLCPQEWTDVVRDGDEIQLGRREVSPGPLITFKYYNKGKYVLMLLPNTCEVSYVQMGSERLALNHPTYIKELKANIRSEFGLSRNVEFKLSHALGYGNSLYVAKIPPAQWLTVIRQLAKENPSCEILIQKC